MRQVGFALCIAMMPSTFAMAHSGHGHDGGDSGLVHYITEPDHAWLVIASAVVVALGSAAMIRWALKRRSAGA